MGDSEGACEEQHSEKIKASDVVVTAHTRGLLITCNYGKDRSVQVMVSRDQALRLTRDILSVMYNMGIKID